jgi:hypothetical protein
MSDTKSSTPPTAGEPATYDPMLYKDAPGAIPMTGRNIAPTHGDLLVGFAPFGLVEVYGENMEGKSRFLSAVRAIPLKTLKAGMLTMTRGETDVAVGLGTSELRVETRIIGGKEKPKVDRRNVDAHGPIEELPDPITLLITGGGHVSADSNWRTRLQALLAFHPVAVTDERLLKLAGALPAPDHDIAAELATLHQTDPFPSLLEAADGLADRNGILQKRAREVETDVQGFEADAQRQQGKIEQLLKSAADEAAMHLADPALRIALLDESSEAAQAPTRHRYAEAYRTRLEVRLDDRSVALGERRALRESHGERPNIDAEQQAVATLGRRISAARLDVSEKREAEAAARRAVAEVAPDVETARELIARRATAWDAKVSAIIEGLDGGDPTDGWPVSDVGSFIAAGIAALNELAAAIEASTDTRQRHARLQVEAAAASQAATAADATLTALLQEEEGLERSLAAASERVEGWQKTADLLAAPLPTIEPAGFEGVATVASTLAALVQVTEPGSDYDEAKAAVLAAADEVLAGLAKSAKLAAAGAPYRAAVAELKRIEQERDEAAERAAFLRADVSATWDRLGEVISTAIESALVRVGQGRSIEILLEDGRWLNVADDIEISKGRLRRAFLEFFLERTPAGERNVLVEDVIMLPIGPAGREEISRRAAAKQIRLLFEQPAPNHDLRVRWYGGAA